MSFFKDLFRTRVEPKPVDRFSLVVLKQQWEKLSKFTTLAGENRDEIVELIRSICELVIWGDQHDTSFFDFFAEKRILSHFIGLLLHQCEPRVQCQIIQTISMLVQNTSSEMSVFYLLSNNHINDLIVFPFNFDNEDLLATYISFLKTLSLKLNDRTVQFFYNDRANDFPLYAEALQFFSHADAMVRISVRTISLNIFACEDKAMRRFLISQSIVPHFSKLANYLRRDTYALQRNFRNLRSFPCTFAVEESIEQFLDQILYFQDVLDLRVPGISSALTDQYISHHVFPLLLNALLIGHDNNKYVEPVESVESVELVVPEGSSESIQPTESVESVESVEDSDLQSSKASLVQMKNTQLASPLRMEMALFFLTLTVANLRDRSVLSTIATLLLQPTLPKIVSHMAEVPKGLPIQSAVPLLWVLYPPSAPSGFELTLTNPVLRRGQQVIARRTSIAAQVQAEVRRAAQQAKELAIALAEAKAKAEAEEKARLKAEEEEKARLKAEEEEKARIKAEEEEKARLKAEEEEKARLKAEEEAQAEQSSDSKSEVLAKQEDENITEPSTSTSTSILESETKTDSNSNSSLNSPANVNSTEKMSILTPEATPVASNSNTKKSKSKKSKTNKGKSFTVSNDPENENQKDQEQQEQEVSPPSQETDQSRSRSRSQSQSQPRTRASSTAEILSSFLSESVDERVFDEHHASTAIRSSVSNNETNLGLDTESFGSEFGDSTAPTTATTTATTTPSMVIDAVLNSTTDRRQNEAAQVALAKIDLNTQGKSRLCAPEVTFDPLDLNIPNACTPKDVTYGVYATDSSGTPSHRPSHFFGLPTTENGCNVTKEPCDGSSTSASASTPVSVSQEQPSKTLTSGKNKKKKKNATTEMDNGNVSVAATATAVADADIDTEMKTTDEKCSTNPAMRHPHSLSTLSCDSSNTTDHDTIFGSNTMPCLTPNSMVLAAQRSSNPYRAGLLRLLSSPDERLVTNACALLLTIITNPNIDRSVLASSGFATVTEMKTYHLYKSTTPTASPVHVTPMICQTNSIDGRNLEYYYDSSLVSSLLDILSRQTVCINTLHNATLLLIELVHSTNSQSLHSNDASASASASASTPTPTGTSTNTSTSPPLNGPPSSAFKCLSPHDLSRLREAIAKAARRIAPMLVDSDLADMILETVAESSVRNRQLLPLAGAFDPYRSLPAQKPVIPKSLGSVNATTGSHSPALNAVVATSSPTPKQVSLSRTKDDPLASGSELETGSPGSSGSGSSGSSGVFSVSDVSTTHDGLSNSTSPVNTKSFADLDDSVVDGFESESEISFSCNSAKPSSVPVPDLSAIRCGRPAPLTAFRSVVNNVHSILRSELVFGTDESSVLSPQSQSQSQFDKEKDHDMTTTTTTGFRPIYPGVDDHIPSDFRRPVSVLERVLHHVEVLVLLRQLYMMLSGSVSYPWPSVQNLLKTSSSTATPTPTSITATPATAKNSAVPNTNGTQATPANADTPTPTPTSTPSTTATPIASSPGASAPTSSQPTNARAIALAMQPQIPLPKHVLPYIPYLDLATPPLKGSVIPLPASPLLPCLLIAALPFSHTHVPTTHFGQKPTGKLRVFVTTDNTCQLLLLLAPVLQNSPGIPPIGSPAKVIFAGKLAAVKPVQELSDPCVMSLMIRSPQEPHESAAMAPHTGIPLGDGGSILHRLVVKSTTPTSNPEVGITLLSDDEITSSTSSSHENSPDEPLNANEVNKLLIKFGRRVPSVTPKFSSTFPTEFAAASPLWKLSLLTSSSQSAAACVLDLSKKRAVIRREAVNAILNLTDVNNEHSQQIAKEFSELEREDVM